MLKRNLLLESARAEHNSTYNTFLKSESVNNNQTTSSGNQTKKSIFKFKIIIKLCIIGFKGNFRHFLFNSSKPNLHIAINYPLYNPTYSVRGFREFKRVPPKLMRKVVLIWNTNLRISPFRQVGKDMKSSRPSSAKIYVLCFSIATSKEAEYYKLFPEYKWLPLQIWSSSSSFLGCKQIQDTAMILTEM